MEISTLNDTMSPQAFYILLAVADRALHGYAIRSQVIEDSQGRLILATGTIYTVLKRLYEQKLVEKYEITEGSSGATYRYLITDSGRVRLEAEMARMQYAASCARYKLSGRIANR